MTNKEKRDFIADEIKKQILGPGLTADVYACQPDYSDEILNDRPNLIYQTGIIFPKCSVLPLLEEEGVQLSEQVKEEDENTKIDSVEDDASSSRGGRANNNIDISESERADFEPDHIGMAFCLNNGVQNLSVEVKYGQYHRLKSEEVVQNVHVKLGRCTLKQLEATFAYYNESQIVATQLAMFGCKNMSDVFVIDETNLTVSPKRIFKDDSREDDFLRASSFPKIKRNIFTDLLIFLLNNPGKEVVLGEGKWIDIICDDFTDYLSQIKTSSAISALLNANSITTLEDCFTFDKDKKTIVTKKRGRRNIVVDNLQDIREQLYVDDPVRDHILPLALQYDFFKREQKSWKGNISLSNKSLDINDQLQLIWKVIDRNNKRYIKIQLRNKGIVKEDKNISNNPNQDPTGKRFQPEAYIYQAQIKVISDEISPYTTPHHSSINDEEYELNELLYRDLPMYGKGVNCGIEWDRNEVPQWIQTTYVPQQLTTAFSSDTKYYATNNACDIYDLTIWSTKQKADVIASLRKIADDYQTWCTEQKTIAAGEKKLDNILNQQEEFVERLNDNINYLNTNDRAFECFKIANTAMYIQMCIARDPKFKKNRELSDSTLRDSILKNDAWDYFSNKKSSITPTYRPFQLAFLVMNVKSTFEPGDTYRKDSVDLIWFPTGGGKTEAYLVLTALTIAERRTSKHSDVSGISVIMRYTLRLLTSQQFERASFLILALDYLRKELLNRNYQISIGKANEPITIGMWIGSSQTPNKIQKLGTDNKYKAFFNKINNGELPDTNPFPVSYCPWCGCKMVTNGGSGYDNKSAEIRCLNALNCSFDKLPIIYIDEQLYNTPPTLLFATVDKFAQLTTEERGRMFGANTNRKRPDLIIQDELHLISGPLGSLVGMYETMVEEICTERDINGNVVRAPKVIVSTATTRNTPSLIDQLYRKEVKTFPVSGVKYDNNFFSHALPLDRSRRLYMGVAPTGHSASELEIYTIAAELVAKEKLIIKYLRDCNVDLLDNNAVFKGVSASDTLIAEIDNYWTLVIYYMNLKSLGRTRSRLGQEIKSCAEALRKFTDEYPSLDFVLRGFENKTTEFTSRQESSKIKELLVEADSAPKLLQNTAGKISLKYNMDIVQATNMISVGIDISRWNVIYMIGQPLTTAEYIQSSSRVARRDDGLVVSIYNSLRNRELSFYENYEPYHQVFYKYVEPLTVTTCTEATIQKLASNLFVCYMGAIQGHKKPSEVIEAEVNALKALIIDRFGVTGTSLQTWIENKIDEAYEFFNDTTRRDSTFGKLLAGDDDADVRQKVMNSLRDIEPNTYILYE